MDNIDKKILNILQDKGRITNAELASKIGLSPPPVLERVRKLEKSGTIKKYSAVVDPKKINKGTLTLVAISLSLHQEKAIEEFIETIKEWHEVLECYHVTGDDDYILKVAVKDIESYENFLMHKLVRLPGVSKIRTSIVLSTIKDNSKILVE
ncbi:Lrp/AsnC family transcriptional regulator [candidate division KSB1 bacterium]|nr:MAG: Lrp/AsnC family transcriptional regulator [candidate division KSB1 bacterium]